MIWSSKYGSLLLMFCALKYPQTTGDRGHFGIGVVRVDIGEESKFTLIVGAKHINIPEASRQVQNLPRNLWGSFAKLKSEVGQIDFVYALSVDGCGALRMCAQRGPSTEGQLSRDGLERALRDGHRLGGGPNLEERRGRLSCVLACERENRSGLGDPGYRRTIYMHIGAHLPVSGTLSDFQLPP